MLSAFINCLVVPRHQYSFVLQTVVNCYNIPFCLASSRVKSRVDTSLRITHMAVYFLSCLLVACLFACLTPQQHAKSISRTDLLQRFNVLSQSDRRCRSNLLSKPPYTDGRQTSPSTDPLRQASVRGVVGVKSFRMHRRGQPVLVLYPITSGVC